MTAIKKLEEQFRQTLVQVSENEKKRNFRLHNQTVKICQLLREVNEYNQTEDEDIESSGEEK